MNDVPEYDLPRTAFAEYAEALQVSTEDVAAVLGFGSRHALVIFDYSEGDLDYVCVLMERDKDDLLTTPYLSMPLSTLQNFASFAEASR